MQTHRTAISTAQPGSRTAVNLANVDPEQLSRGQVVTTPGWLKPTIAVDVRLRVLDSTPYALRHNLNVTFHSLASESPARLRLLEGDELLPGDEAWAQVLLRHPLALLKGDRFIIRDSNTTLAGGTIVDTHVKRHPRRRPSVIEALERQQSADPVEIAYESISAAQPADIRAALSRTALSEAAAEAAIEQLQAEGRIVLFTEGRERRAWTANGFERLHASAVAAVENYLGQHPLRRGIGKEELRSQLNLQPRLFNVVLPRLVENGRLADAGELVSLAGWQPTPTPQQQATAERYLADIATSPFSPPTDQRPDEEVVAYLEDAGLVVDCGAGVVFTRQAFEEMTRRVVALAEGGKPITLAEVRDALGTSRRYVQPLLEELDRRRITLRRGDERVLRGGPTASGDEAAV